jgi:MFS family permease
MGDIDQPVNPGLVAEPSANSEKAGTENGAPNTPALSRQAVASIRLARRRIGGALLKSLIAVLVGSLILRLASHATGQMTQFYLRDISRNFYHISHTTRGYVIASFFITELVGSLVLGAMSDRYGRKLFMMLGPVFGVIAVQLTAMTSVLWLLVLARLLEGLSTGSSVPSTLGYISEATIGRPSLRARVMGMFELTLVGGIALGAVIGGYLLKFFDSPRTVAGITMQSPAFSIVGLIYVISLAVFAWGLKDVSRTSTVAGGEEPVPSQGGALRKKLKHYYAVFKSPSVWMFIPAWLSIFSIIGIWTNNSAGLFTGDHFKSQKLTGSVTPVTFENGFAALAVFFAVGVLAWSFVLSRFRKTNVMLIGTLSLFALLLTVFGLNHLGSFSSSSFYLLLGALLIEVLVMSGFTPAALTYLADVTESYAADRGSIMGLYSVFLGIGQLIGTSVGGYFADWNGVDGLILLSATLGGITAISLLTLRRRDISEGDASS